MAGHLFTYCDKILDLKSDDRSKFPFCHVDGFDELCELTWIPTDLLNKPLLSNYNIAVILPSFGVKMGLEELGQQNQRKHHKCPKRTSHLLGAMNNR